MRKMIIEFTPAPFFQEMLDRMYEHVESYNLLELIKIDFEHGLKAGVIEVTMREGHTLDDLELPAPAELVSILHHEGRTYTAIVKVTAPEGMLELFRKFDLDLIWDTPMALSQGRVTLSVIGEEEDLKRVLEIWESIGTVEEVTFQRPSFHPEDVLDALTVRQREVLTAAKRYGYYDYPRRMNAEELAQRVGVSKATLVEHLRKAEGRLVATLLAGH